MDYFKTKCLDENHNNYFIYSLDTSELFISHKLIKDVGSVIPVFSNSKSNIKKLYEKINSEPSPNFQKNDKKRKEKFISRHHHPSDNVNLIYTPSNEDEINCQNIVQGIKDMLYQHIVKSIPSRPLFSNKEKKVLKYFSFIIYNFI